MINERPPKGVIGPKIDGLPTPVISRTLKIYKDPEKNRIPMRKAIKDTLIELCLGPGKSG
ncbi:hypothetical protein QE382_001002 [Sphingobacterium zeae]|uniref:Uncharacterized protein n=1 Tax=Sphingobacterium zeae TaxID=1776859 RepID=A0ABU0U246_9SPHI|nr:hypothetical protein [Sphingobacterium zeae]